MSLFFHFFKKVMEVYNCNKSKYRCKSRVKKCGSCGQKIELSVKCPPPVVPLPPIAEVDYRKYTVGGGSGPLANQYEVAVPEGTQYITIRLLGAGGGGGGTMSEVFSFFCIALLTEIPFVIPGAGGGGSGRCVDVSRPYTPGFPTTLNIEVGAASLVPTDPNGDGLPGGDSMVSFAPFVAGFEDVIAKGGAGGAGGKVLSTSSGIVSEVGVGGQGGCGGGGGGAGNYFCENLPDGAPVTPGPNTILITTPSVPGTLVPVNPAGGGLGLDLEDGETGNLITAGDGGNNVLSGSAGAAQASSTFGGGGGGAGGVLVASSGGIGGAAGDMGTSNVGGDFQIQDTGAAGAGAGIYTPVLAEVGSTIAVNGGLGAHGAVEVFFYIFPVPA